MISDRRQFIGTLLASLGGLTLAPGDLLWKPSPCLMSVRPDALIGLQEITRTFAQHLAGYWAADEAPDLDLIGLSTPFPHHLYVNMVAPDILDRDGLDADRYIRPAAIAMARALHGEGARRCGSLRVPTRDCQAVRVYDKPSGIVVRGMLATEHMTFDPQTFLRFDVLAGS